MAYATEPDTVRAGEAAALAPPALARSTPGVWAAVLREHGTIRALLENVRRATVADGGVPALARLRRAVWTLYTTFVRHQEMEEANVAPVLRGFDAWGETRATAMILEHNEQRRLLVALVEECEREAKTPEELATQTYALLAIITDDMAIEERELAPIFEDSIVTLHQEDG